MNEKFNFTDIHYSDGLAIQRNPLGELRLIQRIPVGGGSPADIPIADSDAMRRLLCALNAAFFWRNWNKYTPEDSDCA